ncbi:hypothetical protein [Mucilaginibacter sp.]
MKSLIWIFLICSIFCSCNQNKFDNRRSKIESKSNKIANNHTSPKTQNKNSSNILKLNYGFYIKADSAFNLGDFNTFRHIEIWRNNIKLLTDTGEEYEFYEKPYPIINKLNAGYFELLIEYNNRPFKDQLILFRIRENKIIKIDTVPTFDSTPKIFNGLLVRAGNWFYGEEFDQNGKRYTSFEPKIYYKFTPNGIRLDSDITRAENRKIYGNIDPFEKGFEIGFPVDDKGRIDTTHKNIFRKKIEPQPKDYFKDAH